MPHLSPPHNPVQSENLYFHSLANHLTMLPINEPIIISPLTLTELRSDLAGKQVEQLSALIDQAFREPHWNEDYSRSRLIFGLGVEIMRPNALLYVAREKSTERIIGYIMGKELVSKVDDSQREQTLFDIAGTTALDYLCADGKRVFYVSGIAVAPEFRRNHIAEGLSLALAEGLRQLGFDYRLGRTALSSVNMRNLYQKLGFKELTVTDGDYPDRSYWLLTLK